MDDQAAYGGSTGALASGEPGGSSGSDEPCELDRCDWDDPLTRLLLLLEIADRPDWLRDIARPTR